MAEPKTPPHLHTTTPSTTPPSTTPPHLHTTTPSRTPPRLHTTTPSTTPPHLHTTTPSRTPPRRTPPKANEYCSLSPKKPRPPTLPTLHEIPVRLPGLPTTPKTYLDIQKQDYPRCPEVIQSTEPRRRHLCLCIISSISLSLVLIVLGAIGVWCLILQPKEPEYSIDHVSVTGFGGFRSIREFQVGVRVENPNKIKGMYYYSKGSYVDAYYTNVIISNGVWPRFYLPSDTVTTVNLVLKGDVLSKVVRNGLREEEVSLRFDLKTPVRFKVGCMSLWKTLVKGSCNVTVANLTVPEANIVTTSKGCEVKLELWPF
ncbi:NDR1/HIN1-like protein 13 [Cornus florida]|uniref:NDR1/HIN1-like protein 13 n=1 Tax=Cornus florida TaxID=4283 RepID=UPI0028999F7A|nr:NDR1/HIN1-like protein 13 [Cornus florida]